MGDIKLCANYVSYCRAVERRNDEKKKESILLKALQAEGSKIDDECTKDKDEFNQSIEQTNVRKSICD